MKPKHHSFFILLRISFVICFTTLMTFTSQAQGTFSGGLQANGNFFVRDTAIGAANTPQYDNLFSGSEGWLNLNYSNWGFNMGLRFDFYQNSNLPDPQDAYSGQGIGFWYISRKIHKLGITAGHFYDQIGTGIIFRAYEARPLAIDNAVLGLRLTYDLTEDWKLKVFTGKQKNPFGANGFIIGTYRPVVNSISIDGFISASEKVQIAPGAGIVNRVMDEESMSQVVAEINTYNPLDSFIPKYNTYAFTAYNRLSVGDFSWYLEGAYKTREAIVGPSARLINKPGTVFYSSLTYSRKGFGITLQGKRTENFTLRTSPNEILTRGVINYLPALTRQNSKRLAARYNAAVQELGELAFQAEVQFKPAKKITGLVNFANVTELDGDLLYREVFAETKFKRMGEAKKVDLSLGLQFQQYNQATFEGKPNAPLVESIVPLAEVVYRIDRKKSIRAEVQYQYTQQDFGQWLYGLVEFSIAPNWSFSVSDMLNIVPKKSDVKENYYALNVAYSHKSNKFTLGYIKQVEGIICTGGVCRFEPAFNGVRLTVNSSF